MFGGLIAHAGTVASHDADPRGGARLHIDAPSIVAEGVRRGESIAVDGVCLTVVACEKNMLTFEVVPETLERSTLGELSIGSRVNVEASLRLGERVGGHFVYGHVDATAQIIAKDAEGQGHRLSIALPPELRRGIVEKGYIAVDGISLTVASVASERFEIALIPETSARTSLGTKGAGDRVNLEIDPLARYALAIFRETTASGNGA